MAIHVADRTSNKDEQIVHAAEHIGRSQQRLAIFREIYRGKKRVKTVVELMAATKLPRTRVLDLGRGLANDALVTKTKTDGVTAYEKVDFFAHHRDKILRLAKDPAKRRQVATKRNPVAHKSNMTLTASLKVPQARVRAKLITIDDISSFSKVRRAAVVAENFTHVPETKFKRGVAEILGERDRFKDWGGEQSDLSSTRLVLSGKRRSAAFAFKGPGTKGKLTPGKMGKNGDQVQRLFRCPAEVFIVQYWAEIDDNVLEQMQKLAQLKSYLNSETIWYGVIDGDDSNRLMMAYPANFPGVVVS